jgi:glycosyltransferase involved in cell wall biosynthesis
MTEFGANQLGASEWVSHGVDLDVFHPASKDQPIPTRSGLVTSKAECRELFDIPQGAFVVGRVDSNTGRKDWGSTWKVITQAFDLGLDHESTLSAFHTLISAPTNGVDLGAMVAKGKGHFMVTNASDWPVGDVVAFMNTFDVALTTSRGEGWGFFPAEAMACGVPVLGTDCSAITEIVGPGGVLVPGKAFMTNPYGVDLVLADVQAMAGQLVLLAKNEERRLELGRLGMEHVRANFSWDRTASWFDQRIESLVNAAQAAEGTAGG